MDLKYVRVFIGRFQPFHNGHLKVLRAAIDNSDHVVVVIGSVNRDSTLKNPFTAAERRDLILGALRPKERAKVSIIGVQDMPGEDEKWVTTVKDRVKLEALHYLGEGKKHYTLVGCHKGADTYYLKLYRGWGRDLIPQSEAMNATDVRRLFFGEVWPMKWELMPAPWIDMVPGSTYTFMMAWMRANQPLFTLHRQTLQKELNS